MGLADQLTLARVAAVPLVVALYVSDFRLRGRAVVP
jgi:hypothetical protein